MKGKITTSYELPVPAAADKPALRWTEDDGADLRALLARRKAAGYHEPSRDVRGQVIKLGRISLNPNTVAASIVALVGLKGEMTLRDLIADMADCSFPHPRARPKDPQWCQGCISGCGTDGCVTCYPCGAAVGEIAVSMVIVRSIEVVDRQIARELVEVGEDHTGYEDEKSG